MQKSKSDIIGELKRKPPTHPEIPTLTEIHTERILPSYDKTTSDIKNIKRMYADEKSLSWKDVLIIILLGGLAYELFIGRRYKKNK